MSECVTVTDCFDWLISATDISILRDDRYFLPYSIY